MFRKTSFILFAGLGLLASSASAQFPDRVHTTYRPFTPPPGIVPDASTPPATAISVANMRSIYGLDQLSKTGAGQTIGIVLWYDDPNIESDLAVFNTQYGLPPCTTANGCFKKVYSGSKPLRSPANSIEISIDVSWSHAIAPAAKIVLVEAPGATDSALLHAIDVAVQNGANIVSMSWGGTESSTDLTYESHFQAAGVAFVASSGDNGHALSWPATSPYVIGVGGTTLTHNQGSYVSEKAWSGSGGGVSAYEPEPSYQTAFQNQGHRGVPDVAYDADPSTGVAIYDSLRYKGTQGWSQWGGTSIGAPQIAGLIAIANSTRAAAGKAPLHYPGDFYKVVADYHDITTGTNGSCSVCSAVSGYDFVTGLGTPVANALVPGLVALP